MRPKLLVASASLGLLACMAAACGSRTELLVPELCATEGSQRACQDGCGTGAQTCSAGSWSACQVPVVTRDCTDGCGDGEDSCVDGRWQGCQVPLVQRECRSVCGDGHETCNKGVWGKCDAPLPRPPTLLATVRDFSPDSHDDFQADYPSRVDLGIVEPLLGPDDKPVYAGSPRTPSTSGAANFDRWFHDSPTTPSLPLDLQLLATADQPGFFSFEDESFFPIDDQLLGNEGRGHNYHFTLEGRTTFEYRGGEVFSFSGDDDMWVFINRHLAINLGGLHNRLSRDVALDDFAPTAGLERGGVYPLHFFFAERHTVESHFTLRTSIADPGSCD